MENDNYGVFNAVREEEAREAALGTCKWAQTVQKRRSHSFSDADVDIQALLLKFNYGNSVLQDQGKTIFYSILTSEQIPLTKSWALFQPYLWVLGL